MGGGDSFPEGETCGLHPSLSFIAPPNNKCVCP
ncbi:hypothetical protein E2C01_090654 [Portunus trituberculatus]|uniref:Uncharacterized protein n=1 Tax=Portunus trituberculatus TaxID=210409 RepID=A0A5B7JH71_PORTR|nr:hypothetical protein [Portunus trituberculatus]